MSEARCGSGERDYLENIFGNFIENKNELQFVPESVSKDFMLRLILKVWLLFSNINYTVRNHKTSELLRK